jgi:hypothetical protein
VYKKVKKDKIYTGKVITEKTRLLKKNRIFSRMFELPTKTSPPNFDILKGYWE